MKVNKLFEEKKRVINKTKGYVPTTMNNAIFLTVGLHDSIQYTVTCILRFQLCQLS